MHWGMILAAFQAHAFLTFPSVPAFKPSKLNDPASDVSGFHFRTVKKLPAFFVKSHVNCLCMVAFKVSSTLGKVAE